MLLVLNADFHTTNLSSRAAQLLEQLLAMHPPVKFRGGSAARLRVHGPLLCLLGPRLAAQHVQALAPTGIACNAWGGGGRTKYCSVCLQGMLVRACSICTHLHKTWRRRDE